eukprot:6173537-Pleurochrysis_carterae.AAC.2
MMYLDQNNSTNVTTVAVCIVPTTGSEPEARIVRNAQRAAIQLRAMLQRYLGCAVARRARPVRWTPQRTIVRCTSYSLVLIIVLISRPSDGLLK